MQTAIRIRTDWVALLVGLLVAAALVSSWRIEGGTAAAPAKVEIVTSPSDRIAVTPDGITAESQNLVPSLPEDGLGRQLSLRNATGEALDVRVRAVADNPILADLVEFDVRAGRRQVYGGSLTGLTAGSDPFALAPGQSESLEVLAWIPEGAASDGWSGRSATVSLELDAVGAR